MNISPIPLLLLACLILPPLPALAFDNHAALGALTRTRAVFDINQGNPELLLLRLQLVAQSWQQLNDAGISPDFIVTFRGGASYFLTLEDHYISSEDHHIKEKIIKQVKALHALGLNLEQCAIAARLADIPAQAFIPEIDVVANGYVSLIGYQNRGYAFIPME